MRILLTKGQSQYGGTRLFADEAAAAFRRQGHHADLLDLGEGSTLDSDLAAAATGAYDLVFSINILGEYRTPAGASLAQLFGCPHTVWHTDYVLAAWDRLKATPPDTTLLVVDPTQIDALTAIAGPDRFRARFFPHAGVGEPAPDEPDAAAFAAARPIPVLWAGSYQTPARPWAFAAQQTQKLMDYTVELATSVDWIAPHQALIHALRALGLDMKDPANRQNLVASSVIDTAVRMHRRHAFLEALAQSGVELHICGQDWEPHLGRFPNATYHGAVDMAQAGALMRHSRVVLNTNGNFGAGSHERPFSAALAGAATFSDHSLYYAAVLRPGVDIELFSWLDLPVAMERLKELSSDVEACWRMAVAAKQATLARHTWDRRVGLILEASGLSDPVAA